MKQNNYFLILFFIFILLCFYVNAEELDNLDYEKLSYALKHNLYPDYAKVNENNYKFIVKFDEDLSTQDAKNLLEQYGNIIDSNFDFNHMEVIMDKNKLDSLIEEKIVKNVDFDTRETKVYVNGNLVNSGFIDQEFIDGLGDEFKLELHLSHYPYNAAVNHDEYDYMNVYKDDSSGSNIYDSRCVDVTSSIVLNSDSGSCFSLKADNIDFDCNNHVLFNDSLDAYVFTIDGFGNVTIEDCVLENYSNVLHAFNASGVSFVNNSASGGVVVEPTEADLRVLWFESSQDVVVGDSVFEDFYSNNTDFGSSSNNEAYLLFFDGVDGAEVFDNNLHNVKSDYTFYTEGSYYRAEKGGFVGVFDSNNIFVFDDVFNLSFGQPVVIDKFSSNVDVNGSLFENVSVMIFEGSNVTFFDNSWKGFKSWFVYSVDGLLLDSNILSDPASSGYVLKTAFDPLNVVVRDNVFDLGWRMAGVYLDDSGVVVSGNVVNHSSGSFDSDAGITVLRPDCVVENNTVDYFNYSGDWGGGIVSYYASSSLRGNKVLNGLDGSGILLLSGNGNVSDSVVENVDNGYDVKMEVASNSLVNVSFNKSNAYAGSYNKLYNYYYLDVFVKDNEGVGINDSLVEVYNVTGGLETFGYTGEDGLSRLVVLEYVQDGLSDYSMGCGGPHILCSTPHVLNVSKNGISSQQNITMNQSKYVEVVLSEGTSESEALLVIKQAVENVLVSNYEEYDDQQIYTINLQNVQQKGRFDLVVTKNNQAWAFNYVTSGETYTNMNGLANTVNIWESQSLTFNEILIQVEDFITNTLD